MNFSNFCLSDWKNLLCVKVALIKQDKKVSGLGKIPNVKGVQSVTQKIIVGYLILNSSFCATFEPDWPRYVSLCNMPYWLSIAENKLNVTAAAKKA